MGLDLTSAPLGMWNRGMVVMGGRVLGDDVGRPLRRRGRRRGGPGCVAGVPLGSGRPGQGGSMREGLAACPGWGEATALGPLCGPLPTVQLPLILNSWHIMGIQALVVLSIGHGAPRSSPPRVSQYNQRSPHQGADEDANMPIHTQ